MKEKINISFNAILYYILRIRLLLILLLPFPIFIILFLFNRYFVAQFVHLDLGYILFKFRKDHMIINNFLEKFILLIDSKLGYLSQVFLYACIFIAILALVHLSLNFILRRINREYLTYITNSLFILTFTFLFSYRISKLTFINSSYLAGIAVFFYFCDFVLINSNLYFKINFLKWIFGLFFTIAIGIPEVLFLPLYSKFMDFLNNNPPNKKFTFFIQYIHFFTLIFLLVFIITPISNKLYNNPTNLKVADTYGLAISSKTSMLFFPNLSKQSIENLRTDSEQKDFKIIYSPSLEMPLGNKEYNNGWPNFISRILKDTDEDIDEIGDQLNVNEDREELYIQDRRNKKLVIIDVNDFSQKGSIRFDEFARGVPGGDCRMVSNNNFLFLGSEDPVYIAKIDVNKLKIIEKKNLDICVCALAYNKTKNVLYLSNYEPQFRNIINLSNLPPCYVYEINPENLEILRKFKIPSASPKMLVSKNGDRLFCAIPFVSFLRSYVYIFDTESFNLIDKIKVPFGVRAIAIDEDKQLLFTGSMANNLIEVIDLRNKKVVKIYKAGNFSLRDIVLDERKRRFFVSTQYFGLFEDTY